MTFVGGTTFAGFNSRRYTGQVATRCYHAQSSSTSNKQMMSRTVHRMRSAVEWVQVAWPNWYASSTSGELSYAAPTSIRASIEYPLGTTPTRLLFNGQQTGLIPSGTTLFSDRLDIAIPLGAAFAVKVWAANTVGIVFTATATTAVDGSDYGVTTADNTGNTTNPPAGTIAFPPVAIISDTTAPSVFLIGDSISQGTNDTADEGGGVRGIVARSIAPFNAFICGAQSGEQASTIAVRSRFERRLALSAFCTHVVSNYGRNDVANSRSQAQITADLQTIFGYFGTKPVFQTTLTPTSTSSDSWATTVNQTTDATNTVRIAVNSDIRGGLTGMSGVFDVADVLESARDSGLWRADLGATTADGIHPNALGYRLMRNSQVIRPELFKG